MKHSASLGKSIKINNSINSSKPSTPKKRPMTPNSKPASTPINLQKREKLKNLLIQKIMKKFNLLNQSLIEKEITLFVQNENLTEVLYMSVFDKRK